VLDGFHIQKYIRRMARLAGGTEETKEENRKKYRNVLKKETGKYIEALRASISSKISAKVFFNTAIAGL